MTIFGLGQPTAAFPAVPRWARAGLLAVPALLIAFGAVRTAVLTFPGLSAPALLIAVAGGTVLVGSQATLWRRQHRLAGALLRSQTSFRTLVKSSVDPVVILDQRLRVTFVSEAITDLLGLDPAAVLGKPIEAAVHPDDAPTLLGALNGPPSQHNELAVRTARVWHADGRWRLIQATVRDLRSDPEVGALVLYCRDVTRAPVAEVDPELLELSLTDPVTGLPNRAALVRRLGTIHREQLSSRFALALIGIDGLADGLLTPGTEATVLRAVTSRLTRALRGEDWLARGKDGDFVVLVDGSIADAEIVAARLVEAFGPMRTPSGILRLTAAAGVITLPDDVDTGEALRHGDLALRSARAEGPGSVHRASPSSPAPGAAHGLSTRHFLQKEPPLADERRVPREDPPSVRMRGEEVAGRSVLAIGAHPDDIELGCGATVLAHSAAGDTVTMLVVTGGENGPGVSYRHGEQLAASAALGAQLRWGGLLDCTLTPDAATVRLIEAVMEEINPDLVYVHAPDDSHQDHRAVAAATLSAGRRHPRLLHYQSPSTLSFNPTVYVDVTAHLTGKLAALRAHASQVDLSAMVEPDAVMASARHWGAQARIGYAEAFVPTRMVLDLAPAPRSSVRARHAAWPSGLAKPRRPATSR